MASTLDGVLNWLVPTLIILAIAALFYTNPKIKEMVNILGGWIKGLFTGAKDKVIEGGTQTYETVYKYG